MSLTPLGEAMSKKLSGAKPLQRQVQASMVVEIAQDVFNSLFGVEQGSHAKPLYLKNRTLTVTCASSSIAQEIRLRQAEIVARINEKMGSNDVDRIRYLA